jgi:hypothetical protein
VNNSDFAMMGLDSNLLIYLNSILEFVLYFVELSPSVVQPGNGVILGVDIYDAVSAMEVESCDVMRENRHVAGSVYGQGIWLSLEKTLA